MGTFYVHPGSTSGGDGTTDATTGPNRAYPSLSDFDANEAGGTAHTVICTSSSGNRSDTTTVTFGTDWTAKVTIQPDSANRVTGSALDSNKYVHAPASGFTTLVNIQCHDLEIDGIQLDGSGASSATTVGIGTGSTSKETLIRNCVICGSPGWRAVDHTGIAFDRFEVRNCWIYGQSRNTTAVNFEYNTAGGNKDVFLYNNTVVDCSTGIVTSIGYTHTWRNNAVDDCATCFSGSAGTTSNNTSSDATSPDGASWRNITITWTDAANDDYSFASSETDLYNNGFDLSGSFTDSGNGETRPQGTDFDVGAYELAVAGGSTRNRMLLTS